MIELPSCLLVGHIRRGSFSIRFGTFVESDGFAYLIFKESIQNAGLP